MRTVTIGASRSPKIGSRLISWWMGTDYSHVYARWHLGTQDMDIVYQASHGMVHFISLKNFISVNEVVTEVNLELTDEQFKFFSAKCIDLAGQPYSVLTLVQIFLSSVFKCDRYFGDQKGYICSELMGDLLTGLGYTFSKPLYYVTPRDIMDTLNQRTAEGCL